MLNDIIKKVLREATFSSTSRGSYVGPLSAGLRPFNKTDLSPFNIPVSDYDSPLVQYDSYDKSWDLRRNQIKELEKQASKITNYIKKHPESTSSDDEGNIINPTPGKGKKIVPIKENSSSVSAGEYSGPIELGLKKWKHELLAPFTEFVNTEINHKKKQKTLKNNIKREVGKWEKSEDGSYDVETHDVHTLKEDLAVWFGTKKKPKGSKQPKGPWVDICRKVNGKHPPCGRSDSDKGSYPKCRAAGVAGKMSDSAKKAACQQKRRAEKKDTQSGKGQKPVMTSYKPRKKSTNENMKTIRITESELVKLIKRVLNEQETLPTGRLDLICKNFMTENETAKEFNNMVAQGTLRDTPSGNGKRFFIKQATDSNIPFTSPAGSSSDLRTVDIEPPTDIINQYLQKRGIDSTAIKLIYLNISSSNRGICKCGDGTDQSWRDFFNSLNAIHNFPID